MIFEWRHKTQLALLLSLLLLWSIWMLFASSSTNLTLSKMGLQFLDDLLDLVTTGSNSSSSDGFTLVPLPPGLDTNTHAQNANHAAYTEDTFAKTYVISLPHRSDRRVGMERLRQVISLNWTYVEAVPADDATIARILGHVTLQRQTSPPDRPLSQEFSWPKYLDSDSGSLNYSYASADVTAWSAQDSSSDRATEDVGVERHPLTCATANRTDGLPYDVTTPPYMVLTRPKVACWYSHVQVLSKFVAGTPKSHKNERTEQEEASPREDDVALILEDDVNVERDFHDRMRHVWKDLPNDWEMLFLGHCWSNESYHPSLTDSHSASTSLRRPTTLHASYAPKCTHAYAVTRHGAKKLLAHLHYPPFAYSRALDQAYAWLVFSGRMKSYSVVPSLVVQRKVSWSDVDAGESGAGSVWREELENGVF